MKYLKCLPVIVLLTVMTNGLQGQFYITGEPPASVRWERIRTESFDVIFPAGMYDQANHFANRLEYYKRKTTDLRLLSKRKMPVIMQGSSVLSNGYVAWTPKRMEIVPVPPQDSYAQDWLSQLAVHEYRHVVQLENLNKGLTRGLSFATGQIAVGLTSAMVPPWLYEGDAVLQETRLSFTGRGRQASFEMPLRAILLGNQKKWSYDKATFGSFKDFVPDHYQYGYQITGFAQARYGTDIWTKAIAYTGRNMFLVWPLPFYLKKNYGVNRSQLYRQAIDSVTYLYNKQKENVTYTDYSILSNALHKSYSNDILPQFTDHDHIAFLRTSLDHTDRLIILDGDGNEKVLIHTGLTHGISLSASVRYLVWDEVVRDTRWAKRSYSEIRMLDLETGRLRSLTKKTRYFSPDISPDEGSVALVETDLEGQNALVILDVASGNVVSRMYSPGNAALQTPRWNNGRIVTIAVTGRGKTLYEVDPETGAWVTLLENTLYDLAEPVGYKDFVVFRSNYTGIDNLFALEKKSGKICQVTSSRYGAFHPEVGPDSVRLVYSDYTGKGFVLSAININPALWTVFHAGSGPAGSWFSDAEAEENPVAGGNESGASPVEQTLDVDLKFDSEPYRKMEKLFRFHSWLPFYTNVPEVATWRKVQVLPGFMLFSQNNLETVISTVGYSYANGNHVVRPSVRWSGCYPVFEATGQFGYYSGNNIPGSDNQDFTSGIRTSNWYELKAYIPMIFTRGSWIKTLQPLLALQHEDGTYGSGAESFSGLDYLQSRLYLATYKRLSYKDLYPRLGFELSLSGTFTPLNKYQLGDLYSVSANFYLPGIGAHHHMLFYAGWQQQSLKQYYLPLSQIRIPRGSASKISESYASLTAGYAFPVFYPDLSLPPLLYIKRLRADLFFDFGYGKDILKFTEEGTEHYNGKDASVGAELLVDLHALRFVFPLSAGIRTGYLLTEEEMFASFLINISTSL